MLSAADVIGALDLKAHPEGGHDRAMFRDCHPDSEGRSRSTAICFLLQSGKYSHWHRIDAAQLWHCHAGAPLCLDIVEATGARHPFRRGSALAGGEPPQAVVAAPAWQSVHSLGSSALVGSTRRPRLRLCPIRPGTTRFRSRPPGIVIAPVI